MILHQLLSPEKEAKLQFTLNEVIDWKDEKVCWTSAKVSMMEARGKSTMISVEYNGSTVTLEYPSREFENRVGKCGTKYTGRPCESKNF